MPPAVASMAQRPQVPETMNQTMQTPAPGMFGRFKQPVTNTAQIPTGQMSLGERPPAPPQPQPQANGMPPMPPMPSYGEGPVQPNAPHPMGGPLSVGQAPGAQVTRMPRPGPYDEDDAGFKHSSLTDRNFGTFTDGPLGNRKGTTAPIGSDDNYYQQLSGHQTDNPKKYMTDQEYTQQLHGDQFNPNRQF